MHSSPFSRSSRSSCPLRRPIRCRSSPTWTASRSARTPTASPRPSTSSAPRCRPSGHGPDTGRRRPRRQEDSGNPRRPRAARRSPSTRSRASRSRRGPGRPTLQQAGCTPVAGQGGQRQHGEEAAARHQPAGRAGVCEPAEGDQEADPTRDRFLDVEMFTGPPMTPEPERAEGRIRRPAHLQQRGRQARGDHRLRRRPGNAGPRLPRRGAGAVRRQPGHPGEARHQGPRRQADGRPLHVHATRPATSIRRRPSGWPPTSSSRSRSIATTAAPCCCRPASSR